MRMKDDQTLPIIQIQQTLQVTEIKETTDQTQPPAYFNEAGQQWKIQLNLCKLLLKL